MLRRLRAQECSGARDLKAAGFLDLHLLLCISFRQLLSIPEFTSPFSQRTDGLNQNPFGIGCGRGLGDPHLHNDVEECSGSLQALPWSCLSLRWCLPQSEPQGKYGAWVCVAQILIFRYVHLCVYLNVRASVSATSHLFGF